MQRNRREDFAALIALAEPSSLSCVQALGGMVTQSSVMPDHPGQRSQQALKLGVVLRQVWLGVIDKGDVTSAHEVRFHAVGQPK